MRVVLAAVAILSLTGWMQVTGTKDMMARDPMDCVNPVAVASPRQMFQTPVASHAIADIPGKTLTSMLLTAPPGSKSLAHRHAGVVFGYVIEGAVCSQITGDAGLKAYVAGDSFFEPAGSQHLAFINPGMVTAKVLVTQVADTGAQLTSPVK
ncbi:MAG: cupin domain-containing protein [Hyphomonadaceae bacterium]